MIYEFALEPQLVARWHDRKEYLFLTKSLACDRDALFQPIQKTGKNWFGMLLNPLQPEIARLQQRGWKH